jgi:hypothetical protein
MANPQGNNPTDRKMLFPYRSTSVGIFLSVNRQKNYFLYFPVGFWYFTVGFVPTGNFEFPIVICIYLPLKTMYIQRLENKSNEVLQFLEN